MSSFSDTLLKKLEKVKITPKNCDNCGEPLIFVRNRYGKFIPVNLMFDRHDCQRKKREEENVGEPDEYAV